MGSDQTQKFFDIFNKTGVLFFVRERFDMSSHGSTYFSNGCIYADIDNLVLRFDNVDVSSLQKNDEMLTGIHYQYTMFGCKPERQYYTNESMMKLVKHLRSSGVSGEMDLQALHNAMLYNVKQTV